MSRIFHDSVSDLTQAMMASYNEDEMYNDFSHQVLPNRDEVIRFINNLRELFYPKHFGKHDIYNCTTEYCTGSLLLTTEERLEAQIRLALRGERNPVTRDEKERVDGEAASLSVAAMQRLPAIRSLLAKDIQAAYEGDPAAADYDQIVFSYPGVFAVMVYRVAHELSLLGVPLIPRVMTEYAHTRTGIDINPGATIGEYFFMDHGTGIVIGETTHIGDHVQIYQGVTLGALSTRGGQDLRGMKRHPTIEDNVTIYSGASILGGETVIGHDSVIGGNAFITQSVEPYSRVSIKNPEHVIRVPRKAE